MWTGTNRVVSRSQSPARPKTSRARALEKSDQSDESNSSSTSLPWSRACCRARSKSWSQWSNDHAGGPVAGGDWAFEVAGGPSVASGVRGADDGASGAGTGGRGSRSFVGRGAAVSRVATTLAGSVRPWNEKANTKASRRPALNPTVTAATANGNPRDDGRAVGTDTVGSGPAAGGSSPGAGGRA